MKRRNECLANYSKTELLEHFQILVVSVMGGNCYAPSGVVAKSSNYSTRGTVSTHDDG